MGGVVIPVPLELNSRIDPSVVGAVYIIAEMEERRKSSDYNSSN